MLPEHHRLTRKEREEIRYQHATNRLEQHRDDLVRASDAWGVDGVLLGLVGFLWLIARCGPVLLPDLLG